MTLGSSRSSIILGIVLVTIVSPGGALADSNFTRGSEYFQAGKNFRVNQSRDLIATAVPPEAFDTPIHNLFLSCFVSVLKGGNFKPVKKAKGEYSAELWVLDPSAGTLETSPLPSGSFKTGDFGGFGWDVVVNPAVFSDNGVVPVVRTKIQFTNSKKASRTSLNCDWGYN